MLLNRLLVKQCACLWTLLLACRVKMRGAQFILVSESRCLEVSVDVHQYLSC